MHTTRNGYALLALAAGMLLGAGLVLHALRPAGAVAQVRAADAAARYTVIETDGTNLLVVDNSSSTLYFYTIDPDAEVGADLKLRGSLDLTQVGRPSLKPHVNRAAKP